MSPQRRHRGTLRKKCSADKSYGDGRRLESQRTGLRGSHGSFNRDMVDSPKPTQASSTNKAKKRRNPNSCDLCKRKKIKCDSAVMPDNRCSECISYGCECVRSGSKRYANWKPLVMFPKEPTPASSAASSASSPNPSAQGPALHPLVQAAVALLPQSLDSALTAAMNRISSHILGLERLVGELRAAAPSDATNLREPTNSNGAGAIRSTSSEAESHDEEEEDDAGGDELAQLSQEFTDMHIKAGSHGQGGKHFGPSSNISLVGMALKVIMEANTDPNILESFRGIRRPLYWNPLPWEVELNEQPLIHEFPPPPLMNELIDEYFREINTVLPMLHKPTFLRAIAENHHILNPQFGEVVLGVCSVAARWSTDPSVMLEGDGVGHSAGWRWFRQIRIFRKTTSTTPSVYDLQSIMLSVFYLGGSSQGDIAWNLLGLAMRYAVSLGAHRKRTLPTADSELWKRAFWVIWCYDVIVTSHVGRSRAMPSDEFDVDYPIDCDDEFWETEDPSQAFKQPPGRPSVMSGFISYLKFMRVMERVHDQLFSVKSSKSISSGKVKAQSIVHELGIELEEWYKSIPEHLKWTKYQDIAQPSFRDQQSGPEYFFYKQAAQLESAYHHVQILIHRPFIFFSKPDSPLFTTSWATCTKSARACIKILNTTRSFMIVHTIMLSLVTICILEKWKVGIQSKAARENVVICLNVAKEVEDRWHCAGKIADIIREIMYLDDLVSYSNPSPGSGGPSGSEGLGIKSEEIFSKTTVSWPTFDMDYLARSGVGSDDDPLAMLF